MVLGLDCTFHFAFMRIYAQAVVISRHTNTDSQVGNNVFRQIEKKMGGGACCDESRKVAKWERYWHEFCEECSGHGPAEIHR